MCLAIAVADIVSNIEDCIEDYKDDPSVAPVFPVPEIVNMCSALLEKLFQHSQMKFEDKTLPAGTYRRQIRFSILNENVGPALQTTSMTYMGGLDTNLVQIHYTAKPYQDIINMLKILDPFHLFANTGCGSLVGSMSASQAADPRSILAFSGKLFPSSADSKRASCPLLAEEWALNAGKLPPRALSKQLTILT